MASTDNRISANKVGLILVLLLAVWLFLSLYPRSEKPAPAAVTAVAASKLRAVGLEDNPDWDGLPEIFAIWADHAEWKDGKTRFAYWHPGNKTYSYYFEAVRQPEGYRFRAISEPPIAETGHYWDESLGEDCPIRFYRSLELMKSGSPRTPAKPALEPGKAERLPVKIPLKDLKTVPVDPPAKP